MGGHLSVLKWLRTSGCPWGSCVCTYASICGKLELLKWAVSAGCPWDARKCFDVAHEHPGVQKWIVEISGQNT